MDSGVHALINFSQMLTILPGFMILSGSKAVLKIASKTLRHHVRQKVYLTVADAVFSCTGSPISNVASPFGLSPGLLPFRLCCQDQRYTACESYRLPHVQLIHEISPVFKVIFCFRLCTS